MHTKKAVFLVFYNLKRRNDLTDLDEFAGLVVQENHVFGHLRQRFQRRHRTVLASDEIHCKKKKNKYDTRKKITKGEEDTVHKKGRITSSNVKIEEQIKFVTVSEMYLR